MKISRKNALKTLGVGLFGFPLNSKNDLTYFKEEFSSAWKSSETYTLKLYNQMPEEKMEWKYTPESYSWRTQFVHFITYNTSQICGRLKIENPNDSKAKIKDFWKNLSKSELETEIKTFYKWVLDTIMATKTETLNKMEPFASEDIPVWRLFYALENHIIHHRGQCVCYLRLNGITPIGFIGW